MSELASDLLVADFNLRNLLEFETEQVARWRDVAGKEFLYKISLRRYEVIKQFYDASEAVRTDLARQLLAYEKKAFLLKGHSMNDQLFSSCYRL
jgi:hypothetical protein